MILATQEQRAKALLEAERIIAAVPPDESLPETVRRLAYDLACYRVAVHGDAVCVENKHLLIQKN